MSNSSDSKIEAIEAIQDVGAKSVSVDGVTTQFDFEQLRRRKRELDAASNDPAAKARRPRSSSIDLSNV